MIVVILLICTIKYAHHKYTSKVLVNICIIDNQNDSSLSMHYCGFNFSHL